MNPEKLKEILLKFKNGSLQLEQTLSELRFFPIREIDGVNLDTHRSIRKGFPEVIFGEGKSAEIILQIAINLRELNQTILITRLSEEKYNHIHQTLPELLYSQSARCAYWKNDDTDRGRGFILIASAGTSDIPVAEEAAITAEVMGNQVKRVYDVGIAGIHRLLNYLELLRAAEVIIAVAGMEGALPSVLGGLIDKPIIGVPTSIGYGTNFHGVSALLTMLNSCASGITVVNIDNGFGAAYAASLINRNREAIS